MHADALIYDRMVVSGKGMDRVRHTLEGTVAPGCFWCRDSFGNRLPATSRTRVPGLRSDGWAWHLSRSFPCSRTTRSPMET